MDELEQVCITEVLMGHNLLITGQAGTGKTHLLTKMVKCMEERGTKVQTTAPTGLAATLHKNACAIHRQVLI